MEKYIPVVFVNNIDSKKRVSLSWKLEDIKSTLMHVKAQPTEIKTLILAVFIISQSKKTFCRRAGKRRGHSETACFA